MTAPTTPPSEALDLTLHIGSGKTGTSSIQHFMHRNRDRLAELGHLYPESPGQTRHTRLGLFIKPDALLAKTPSWRRQGFASPDEFRDAFRDSLFAEINAAGLSRVVLSDEALYGSPNDALRRLRSFTDDIAGRVRVVVYLRRQDDHLISRYQQVVKIGDVRPLAEWARQDFGQTYDYRSRLDTWQRLLEPTELVVRRFERDSFVDGSLYQDFLDAVGIDVRADDLQQVTNRNESLDAEAVEFLRLLNVYRVENEGAEPRQIDNRKLVPRLSKESRGPTLTLPESVLDDYNEAWEESNRAVARDFLGDEGGQLFRTPRKTDNTTTEQRVDPARLDEFVTLLELPEKWRDPLRRLAEEAKGPKSRRTPPLSKPVDLVLHIGTGKTGTSSVQFFLRDNRERLRELGHLYPKSPGGARHGRLSLFIKSDEELLMAPNWYRQKQSNPAAFRKAFRHQLFAEIERSGVSRVILSDEGLYSCSDPALQRLRGFTDRIAHHLRLVVYLRRQDDQMVSRYQQMVKTGEVRRLAEWAQQDMAGTYDYHTRLRTFSELLEPAEFVVRRFEPDRFVDGSLHQDFLDAIGIDARADELQQVPNRNESLDAESVEFLRLVNLYRVEHEAATAGVIDNRKLVLQLAEASTGAVVTLPDRTLDEFMARWTESNQAVAREFLGDETGELFRMPRRSGNTTTEQRFDPDRLDHFVTRFEIPEPWRAPLRRLAEREASAGR